jgi:Amt family ammonium transporter
MGSDTKRWLRMLALAVMVAAVWAPLAFAQEEVAAEAAEVAEEAISNEMFTVNNTWMLVSTFLVFIMHLGFATLEAGLTQAKNTVNILFKNTGVVAIGLLTYAICGFNLMYPGDTWMVGEYFGFAGFGIGVDPATYVPIEYYNGQYTYWTDFIFQAMFAATAATIVSGAVAERVKLGSFLIFTTLYVGLAYPIAGSWKWGGGWLGDMGFYDFAGSTLVHSVGGWGALAFVLLLGPRTGKYSAAGARAIEGHSMPLATIGVFLLWLGWFGFNGGSVLSADAELVSLVFVTTSLAAAAGVMGAMATTWIVQHKPDLSMVLNGSLAGLVGITAGADQVSPLEAVIIGAIAGVLVVFSVLAFDKIRIDDPVGALSVHLVCGVWGTMAVALFAPAELFAEAAMPGIAIQGLGVAAYGVFSFVVAFVIVLALKLTLGIRVSEEEEAIGLDIGEHGMEAYGGFQIFASK